MLGIVRDATFEEVPTPGVLVFPGGVGTARLVDRRPGARLDTGRPRRARWTTSVCTGSLVLAAAGLLDGVTATTHWAARTELAALAHARSRTGWSSTRNVGS